jgi:hypothetical protein
MSDETCNCGCNAPVTVEKAEPCGCGCDATQDETSEEHATR